MTHWNTKDDADDAASVYPRIGDAAGTQFLAIGAGARARARAHARYGGNRTLRHLRHPVSGYGANRGVHDPRRGAVGQPLHEQCARLFFPPKQDGDL